MRKKTLRASLEESWDVKENWHKAEQMGMSRRESESVVGNSDKSKDMCFKGFERRKVLGLPNGNKWCKKGTVGEEASGGVGWFNKVKIQANRESKVSAHSYGSQTRLSEVLQMDGRVGEP